MLKLALAFHQTGSKQKVQHTVLTAITMHIWDLSSWNIIVLAWFPCKSCSNKKWPHWFLLFFNVKPSLYKGTKQLKEIKMVKKARFNMKLMDKQGNDNFLLTKLHYLPEILPNFAEACRPTFILQRFFSSSLERWTRLVGLGASPIYYFKILLPN